MSIGPEDGKYCTLLGEDGEGIYSNVFTNDSKKFWKDGIVPYVFNDNVTSELKGSAMEAMKRSAKISPMRNIVKYTDETNYIKTSSRFIFFGKVYLYKKKLVSYYC